MILTATNDALDKFLLGICKFCSADQIVRLGGQSKNKEIDSLDLSSEQSNDELMKSYHKKLKMIQKKKIREYAWLEDFKEIVETQKVINHYSKMIEETRELSTYLQIKRKRIVGMTTSFAAKSCALLKMLKGRIGKKSHYVLFHSLSSIYFLSLTLSFSLFPSRFL